MKDKLIKPSDIVFTAVIVAVCILIWFFALPKAQGGVAVFRLDGEIMAELPLQENAEYEMSAAYTNLFEIKDGCVRVAYTDCPNHQCEKTGAVSAAGASIVCAPNRASVTIEGEGGQVDAVTG
ncbi:NusG domain II-containing protein [Christensenellaceae bacterium OttesenSCG-928-K19]|nr:NusG domain II-containing protein [Christensenellaceae bacterium OttesenSCG-928-K19]